LRGQARGDGVDDEQREGRGAGALVGSGPVDDEDGVGLIDAGDVILLSAQQ
jgi:hypothetical protein